MKKILLSIATVALVSVVAVKATGAFFTDTDTSNGNILSSGTLAMDVNDNNPGSSNFAIDLGNTSNLQPGDATNVATITMKNEGSGSLGWFGYFSWTGNTELADKIYIKSAKMEFLTPSDLNWTPTDEFITNGTGSGAYGAYYTALAATDPIGKISLTTWNSIVKNNMMGTGGGVFTGALNPNYKYRLSIQFALDTSADNTYQNKSINLVFNVKSTQVLEAALVSLDGTDSQISIAAPAAIVTWMNTQLASQP